jgi:hypothetical protein
MSELALLVLLGAAAGADVLELLGVEELLLPHADRPTTVAAARTEAANHRLRIVSSPFTSVTPLRVHQGHVRYAGIVQGLFRLASDVNPDEIQAEIRWQSQASESGYR